MADTDTLPITIALARRVLTGNKKNYSLLYLAMNTLSPTIPSWL